MSTIGLLHKIKNEGKFNKVSFVQGFELGIRYVPPFGWYRHSLACIVWFAYLYGLYKDLRLRSNRKQCAQLSRIHGEDAQLLVEEATFYCTGGAILLRAKIQVNNLSYIVDFGTIPGLANDVIAFVGSP